MNRRNKGETRQAGRRHTHTAGQKYQFLYLSDCFNTVSHPEYPTSPRLSQSEESQDSSGSLRTPAYSREQRYHTLSGHRVAQLPISTPAPQHNLSISCTLPNIRPFTIRITESHDGVGVSITECERCSSQNRKTASVSFVSIHRTQLTEPQDSVGIPPPECVRVWYRWVQYSITQHGRNQNLNKIIERWRSQAQARRTLRRSLMTKLSQNPQTAPTTDGTLNSNSVVT